MSATEYDVNLRDIFFILFEQLGMDELLKLDAFKDFESADARVILEEATKFAKEVVNPLNRPGDEEGCHFENGKVSTPKGFKELYKQYCEAGWLAMTGNPEYGGQGMPRMLSMPVSDIFTGANCSFALYHMLTVGAYHVINHFMDEEMKQLVLPKMYSGVWSGTMVLTEPQAGSDLSQVKTTATPVPGENTYLIEGSKLFITAGDQDMSQNVIHMVLARLPEAPAGTKGISLFLVPKYRFNADGTLGEFNDVNVVRIEHKHGITGSATCQMAFGDAGACKGYLVGQPHSGMKIMFQMMNEARLEVGVQGMTHGAAAYMYARAFADDRIQGGALTAKDPQGPRVPIVQHPDVRRMLMHLKAYSEGMRAFIYGVAKNIDLANNHPDPEVRERNQDILELLTPICKAYGSDYGLELANTAIQLYGGVGYTKEYPVEQLSRDTRIATIYEGTNGIQALDLFGRKLTLKKGALYKTYMKEVTQYAMGVKDHATLGAYAGQLLELCQVLSDTTMKLGAAAMGGNLEGAATWAVPYLYSLGDTVMAYNILQQAVIADAKLNTRLAEAGVNTADKAAVRAAIANSEESKFYAGKLDNLKYFYRVVLPMTRARIGVVGQADPMAMEAWI